MEKGESLVEGFLYSEEDEKLFKVESDENSEVENDDTGLEDDGVPISVQASDVQGVDLDPVSPLDDQVAVLSQDAILNPDGTETFNFQFRC